MSRSGRAASALLALALIAGCGAPSVRAAREPAPDQTKIITHQAQQVLARYDQAAKRAGGGKVVVTSSSEDPYNEAAAMSIDWAKLREDGRGLTVGFIGVPDPATVPCGIDYTAEPVESANAVAVMVF